MFARLTRPVLLLAATAALSACSAFDTYGTGVSVGYSSGGYYPYGYSPYSYYGWYDGFYYPGTGYYIYDSYGARHRWSDRHRRYWEGRGGGRHDRRDNWDGYRRDRDGRYHDGNRGEGRGDYSRRRDGNERGDRGDWQRDGNRENRGDRGNWQRRGDGNRGGDSAGTRQSAPPVARPQPDRSAQTPRAARQESRNGRPSVDRGREFRRGSRD